MLSIESREGHFDIQTLIREHILYGTVIPSGTLITINTVDGVMKGIESVVTQSSWIKRQYQAEHPEMFKKIIKSKIPNKRELSIEEEKIYKRFSSVFKTFEEFCNSYYTQREVEERKYGVQSNWGLVEGLDRTLGSNRRGIAIVTSDWQGRIDGGTPRNPLKIGGLVNRMSGRSSTT